MADTVDSKRVKEYNEEDTPEFEQKLDELAAMVRASKYTVFYTGAGVSTAAGIGDYRGPNGAWTLRKIKELQKRKASGALSAAEAQELKALEAEAAKEEKKASKPIPKTDAQPTATHMAQATMIRHGLGHFVVTTNLDGVYRKTGLVDHVDITYLHGDMYIERCTRCGHDFERNFHVRQEGTHVHDHHLGECSRCGSKAPKHYTGRPSGKMKDSAWGGVMVGTHDRDCGTKDTHINFGECLDDIDWNDAEVHCGKADLCIVAGTSMSLRHITHFPFTAKKTVIINLQATPDDRKADLRIWARCDPVFLGLIERLGLQLDPLPIWRPRDEVPIDKLPRYVTKVYRDAAVRLQQFTQQRLAEAGLSTGADPAKPRGRATSRTRRTPSTSPPKPTTITIAPSP